MKNKKAILALVLVFVFMLGNFAMAKTEILPEKEVSVVIMANYGGKIYSGEKDMSITNKTASRGTVYTLEAVEKNGVFLYWYDENARKVLSFDTEYTFTLIDDTEITAVFVHNNIMEDQSYVAFLDACNKVFKASSVVAGENASAPNTSGVDNAGYDMTGWDSEDWKNVPSGEFIVINAAYEKKDLAFNISLDGGYAEPSKDAYEYDEEVNILLDKSQIPVGKVFAGFKINGELATYEEDFNIRVGADMEIEAVFAEEAPEKKPLSAMVDADKAASVKGASFLTYRYVPEGYTLVESGILFAPGTIEGDIELNATSVQKFKSVKNDSQGFYRYNRAIADGSSVKAVAYVIYEYEGDLYITYSSEVTVEN